MIKLLWGLGTILIFVSGIYWTIKLRAVQFRFKDIIRSFSSSDKGISPFKSLTMALAGRIGVGSLAGVALAIYLGGYGSIFWMWVVALLSSSNGFAEVVLGMVYQQKDESDVCIGGPSYYIKKGLGNNWLAYLYAFIIIFSYIVGFLTIQANTISVSIGGMFNVDYIYIGIFISIISFLAILGGVKKISNITSVLVPVMSIFYLGVGLFIILINFNESISIVGKIISDAFNVKSFGYGVITSLVIGVQRGIFSNEAGLGTGAIAGSVVVGASPVKQGFCQVSGIYITTLLVGTVTALVILLSGVDTTLLTDINGIEITTLAFSYHIGNIGEYIVMMTIVLFAFSTIVTGYYYGESSLKFIFNNISDSWLVAFKIVSCLLLIVGSVISSSFLWNVVDVFVILMALINIPVLFLLKKDIMYEYNNYKS